MTKAIIKNYLNYTGSKDRYLPEILKHIKRASKITQKTRLIDLFCGSAVVAINSWRYFNETLCNDACPELIKIHKWVQEYNINQLLVQIGACESTYKLSKTNKEGFLQLRDDYNALEYVDPVRLFCLVMHSFNYSMHLTKQRKFSVPFGANRSSFNRSLREKLINYKLELDEASTSLSFTSNDFMTVMSKTELKDTTFFVDPPYTASITRQPYRTGLQWGKIEDLKLFHQLDRVHEAGGYFIFTNVIDNNGVTNEPLKEWCKKYSVEPVGVDYSNASYQRKNRGKTNEVIITNF